MATVDGEKLRATKKITNDWYNQPREKRSHATNEKARNIHKGAEYKVGQARTRGETVEEEIQYKEKV